MESMDVGESKDGEQFMQSMTELSANLKEIDAEVTKCIEYPHYDKLSAEEKVKFDLYLAYTANSLYYMYLKLQGVDVEEHGIKDEIAKVRQLMVREKQIRESKTLRPKVDKAAAERFVKHGIHYREKRNEEEDQNGNAAEATPSTSKSNDMETDEADESMAQTISDSSDVEEQPPEKKAKENEDSNVIDISDDESPKKVTSSKKKKKKRKMIAHAN